MIENRNKHSSGCFSTLYRSIGHHGLSARLRLTFCTSFHNNRLMLILKKHDGLAKLQLNLSGHLITQGNNLSSNLI